MVAPSTAVKAPSTTVKALSAADVAALTAALKALSTRPTGRKQARSASPPGPGPSKRQPRPKRFRPSTPEAAAKNGKVLCPHCRMQVAASDKAMNTHVKRFHNPWAARLGAAFPCWLCGWSVQAQADAYRRHRRGLQACRRCARTGTAVGDGLGEWVVRRDPGVVLLHFKYWQFGWDFAQELRVWWAQEVAREGETFRWVVQWFASEHKEWPMDTKDGPSMSAVPLLGGPTWQIGIQASGELAK